MLQAPRILDRQLGVIAGDHVQWKALEEHLEAFVAAQASQPVDESDEHGATREYVRRLAGADLLRLMVPAEHGGAFAQPLATPICLVRQWLSRHGGVLDTAFVMQGLGSYPVTQAGLPGLRAELLPRVARGEILCAFALTEPGAGSDVSGMQTLAEPDEDGGVRLHGEKCFISNAGVAGSYVVFAREAVRSGGGDDGDDGKPRYGAFWVPGDAPGLEVEPIRVIAPHPIGTVRMNGVYVSAEHRLGAPGDGLKIALGTLELFRVTVGAAALGLADRALDEAVRHLKQRVQFGKPLAQQQGLRFALADVVTDHVAAQMLVYRAAGARDEGRVTPDMPAMAKLHATESAQRTIDRAVQCLGGLGVTVGQATERLYREIRALRIYEGTSEIQKLVIARALFGR
ncbi:acyl-CoA dehydrogenase family protein [Paraliomyxa miuraensis]|uniref:acyl-CoA dehydrogenase family protein n=1 Tax=Paraliomyxa miuraensis TaxID=376150 RepID=UPI002251B819|nr:acyl-CoA dehydrogenase family protein [Paraliomyxa miuraensis]MCX4242894.1 acyl-CoA dehydrogenase family protein [Paraliomyxa miuraensis]